MVPVGVRPWRFVCVLRALGCIGEENERSRGSMKRESSSWGFSWVEVGTLAETVLLD